MSDLIRREDVIKLVNQFVFGLCKEQNEEVRRTFNKYIEKIPTAYDINKVVEELDIKLQSIICGDGYNAVGRKNKIIEIVKQGVVTDDFCEWTQSGDMAISPHTFSKYKIKQCDGLYALSTCPYCGKKIKVVE